MSAKILIVEDEAITAMDLKNTLERLDFKVVSTASDGKEAIEKTEKLKPDLILMDIMLKGEIDGVETAEIIKRQFNVPIVYLTAHSDDETFERVKLTQPYGFLTKPFDQEGIRVSIETALYKHELDKKLKESEEKFQLMYQDAPLPYQSLNESGHISDVNQVWLDTLGYSRDEVIGKWFGDFLKTNSADKFMENFSKFKAKGEICNIEFEIKCKNNSIIIAEFNGKIGHDEQGNFQRTHCIFQDITKQKEAEKKLRENKERYKQFFNNPLLGFASCKILTDDEDNPVNFVYLKVNHAFENFTGLKREEVVNKKVTDVLPYEDVADIIEIYGKVALTGESTVFEYPIPSLDKYYEISAFSPQNKRFIAFFTDITERKKSEEALLESEQRMNKSQEIAHIGSWELDIVNNYLFWSDEVYRIFGLQPQEFSATYDAFLEAIHPDDREAVDEAYSGSLREGRDTYEIEHRVIRKSTGEVRFVHEKCEHIRDESCQIIRSVGMVHDITDHRKMEEELRQARDHLEKIVQERTEELENAYDSLKESELKFREIFNKATDMISLSEISEDGLPGKYIEINEVGLKRLGYTKEEMLNMGPTDIIAPDKRVEMPKNAVEMDKKGFSHFEIVHVTKEDKKMPVEIYGHIINYQGQKVYLTVSRDITERKRAEKELKETLKELERSNGELQTFAYITSHDLQEPLRTISSYAGLLKRRYEGQLDKDADEFIEFMVDGAARMKNMIQSLLDYSRVGTKDSEFEEFNADEALKQALSNLQSSIDEFHAEVIYDLLPVIHADESQISRVFQNLMGNALKFRKEGVKPKIHISAKKEGKEWIFSVRDNGIGMEEQYTHKIFQVFRRLHTMDEYHGTGIGLAIVKKIIELHGGRVWVESEIGKGSTFYFTIPIDESEK